MGNLSKLTEAGFSAVREKKNQESNTTPPQTQAAPAAVTDKKRAETKKVVFGVKMSAEVADRWRAYTEAAGETAGEMTERILTDYMAKHPLNSKQIKKYDMKLAYLQSRRD